MFEVNITNAYLSTPICQKELDNECWRICEQKCKELRQEPCDEWGIQSSECDYHYDLKMEEVKNFRHKEQTHYPTYECPCKEHEKQQQEFEQWTRITEDSMYHRDYGCDLEDCQCCRSNTEDDCLIHKKKEDNGSNPTPSKKLWATTIKDSKNKESEWEILSFEEHEEEILRILSLMKSVIQKKTCPITRAL
ncbi:hypothetical protein LOZ65_006859 [Ophidiomyces ophidiicola]|nr:hypothetical protein LOZ65_006859 [Ophidiomyces ophidiicola]